MFFYEKFKLYIWWLIYQTFTEGAPIDRPSAGNYLSPVQMVLPLKNYVFKVKSFQFAIRIT